MQSFDDLFEEVAQEKAEQPELSPFDMDEYKARKQQERNDVYTLLENTAEEIKGSGELFQTYLDVQARFDRYSVNNALLITAQMPEATRLADFDTWKDANVRVEKGESAISILEPGKEYTKEDGSTGTSFNVKKVFDISQTNSRDRTTPTVTRDERLLLKSLISNAPCKMAISEAMSETLNAIYKPDAKTIFVRQGMDAPTIFRSLANELAHAHMDKGDYRRNENTITAYCVSYVLCKRYGVSVDSFSFNSMPEQYSKMNTQEFRAELGKIRDVAGEISRDMNLVLDAQNREKKDRGDAR